MSLAEIQSVMRRGQLGRAASLTVPEVTVPEVHDVGAIDTPACDDDLARNVYCVLGMPIDAIDMSAALRRIEAAVDGGTPLLISTPNLNFLVNSRSDQQFRESLLDSDLCPADGMPIVWIARLMGIPIKERIAGSDIFQALKRTARRGRRLKVFLFGGAKGVALAAARTLNVEYTGLRCVGSINPGVGAVDEMSRDDMIDTMNSSGADFLAVSLGAKKGQLWLQRNHKRLRIPVRAHLGATINFQAGTIKRAPASVRACGLEWLWRIKEEPYLWRRYWHDGRMLLWLLLTRVLPLAIASRLHRFRAKYRPQNLLIRTTLDDETVIIRLSGAATERHIAKAISCFRKGLAGREKAIIIDLSDIRVIDARFLGLLLVVRKQLKRHGAGMKFIGVSRPIARMFRLNELGFLLAADERV
jgi:N-acetylglucosaminyldiphosphoundecaprenol N-acetyl-beta-D-mannosaminyltransferase